MALTTIPGNLFISENNFYGKIESDYQNMRTDFAWMHALGSLHLHMGIEHSDLQITLSNMKFQWAFIILPKKEEWYLQNKVESIINELKNHDIRIAIIQEGPHWYYEDYSIPVQIQFINIVNSCDLILCHNSSDLRYYKGMYDVPVRVLPTLLIDDLLHDIESKKEDKVILSGNMCSWYGGLRSFRVAQEFDIPIYAPQSGRKKELEENLVNILPWVRWDQWMRQLSSFKYGINMMPTAAAGTFSLNCAYFGIPCIGNNQLDTQNQCYPETSVSVDDISGARFLAKRLHDDEEFYNRVSIYARKNWSLYFSKEAFVDRMKKVLAL